MALELSIWFWTSTWFLHHICWSFWCSGICHINQDSASCCVQLGFPIGPLDIGSVLGFNLVQGHSSHSNGFLVATAAPYHPDTVLCLLYTLLITAHANTNLVISEIWTDLLNKELLALHSFSPSLSLTIPPLCSTDQLTPYPSQNLLYPHVVLLKNSPTTTSVFQHVNGWSAVHISHYKSNLDSHPWTLFLLGVYIFFGLCLWVHYTAL